MPPSQVCVHLSYTLSTYNEQVSSAIHPMHHVGGHLRRGGDFILQILLYLCPPRDYHQLSSIPLSPSPSLLRIIIIVSRLPRSPLPSACLNLTGIHSIPAAEPQAGRLHPLISLLSQPQALSFRGQKKVGLRQQLFAATATRKIFPLRGMKESQFPNPGRIGMPSLTLTFRTHPLSLSFPTSSTATTFIAYNFILLHNVSCLHQLTTIQFKHALQLLQPFPNS